MVTTGNATLYYLGNNGPDDYQCQRPFNNLAQSVVYSGIIIKIPI